MSQHVVCVCLALLAIALGRTGQGHPVTESNARPDDRVGDGILAIDFNGDQIQYANTTRQQSGPKSAFVFPETTSSDGGGRGANYVSSKKPKPPESASVGFPSETEDTLTYPKGPSSESRPVDSANGGGINLDEVVSEQESNTERTPGLYHPSSSLSDVGWDNVTTTSLPSEFASSSTDRPLRETNSILIPATDVAGRPSCLLNPSDTYCESVQNYPKAELKKDIHLSPGEFRELFGVTSIDGRKMYQDEDTAEERVCRRIPKVIYPQMAKNQGKQWVYIVNDVEYAQAVVSEVCEKEDKPCAYLDHNLPPGVYSRCRQKFAYRRLLAIHPTEKRTYTDTFQFPSCCACYVKSPSFARSKE